MLKTCVEWQVISLQSFEHFDIISVVCSVYNMENCDICFSACFAVKRLLFWKKTRKRQRKTIFAIMAPIP